MRRIQKILITVFCAGVLTAGLGTGMALYEFSTFTYAGEKEAGPVERKTIALDYKFEATAEEPLNIGRIYGYFSSENNIVEDDTVPEHTVRFRITYNACAVEPYLNEYDSERRVDLDWFYIGNDVKIFMDCKDQLLEGIKNRELMSFDNPGIEEVHVMVNPASMNLVRVN